MNRPRLGQHFLVDKSYLHPILEAAEVTRDDGVIEVGPGRGVLTQALAKVAGRVIALEVDPRLAATLQARFTTNPNLEIRLQDARRLDWTALGGELRAAGFKKVKLVANLPYYLATQMVIHALAAPGGCDRLVIMVQAEVAKRMCAQPGGGDYSSYSVNVQYWGEPSIVVKVPPTAFFPKPRVNSAVVRVDRRKQPPVEVPDPDQFFFLVQSMFSHRRKTLRRCLQGLKGVPELGRWEAALAHEHIDPTRRPETLSLEELAGIMRALNLKS